MNFTYFDYMSQNANARTTWFLSGAEDPGLISLNEHFSAYLFYYPLIRGDVKLAKLLVDSYGGNDGILDNGASQFAACE